MTKDEIRTILGDAVQEDGGLSKLGDGIYLSWPDWGCKMTFLPSGDCQFTNPVWINGFETREPAFSSYEDYLA